MALTAAAGLGETNNSGSATIAISPSRDVQVGEFIVITLTSRDYTLSSVSDNSSQAGTANSYTADVAKTTIDPYVYIVSCQVTRKILSTDTITATWASSAGQRSTMCVVALPDANESAQLDKTSSRHSFSAASTYTSNAVATTAQADEYAVGVAAFAASGVNAGTITADSPWTLEYSTTVGSGYAAAHGSQVLTATGTPAFTGGWGATETGQQEAAIATYKGTTSGGPTTVEVTGKGSDATFGTVIALPGSVGVAVTGLGSAAAFGSVTILAGGVLVAVTGLGSAASFGGVTAVPGNLNVSVSGKTSAAAFGTVTIVIGNITIAVTGLTSAANFGTVTSVAGNISVAVTGLGSAASFGTVTASTPAGGATVAVTGLGSAASFGTVTTSVGNVDVAVSGKTSAAFFGTITITTGNVNVAVSGLDSAGMFGVLVFNNQSVSPAGLGSAGIFGAIVATGVSYSSPSMRHHISWKMGKIGYYT